MAKFIVKYDVSDSMPPESGYLYVDLKGTPHRSHMKGLRKKIERALDKAGRKGEIPLLVDIDGILQIPTISGRKLEER